MDITVRKPVTGDGLGVHQVVRACPELDANSLYAYLLLCTEFDQTSRVALDRQGVVGFITGLRPPRRSDTVLVWQVAVAPRARGLGVGGRMLLALASDLAKDPRPVSYLEATVSPGNSASRALFAALARALDAELTELPYITEEDFGPHSHEAEPMIRIGPFLPPKR